MKAQYILLIYLTFVVINAQSQSARFSNTHQSAKFQDAQSGTSQSAKLNASSQGQSAKLNAAAAAPAQAPAQAPAAQPAKDVSVSVLTKSLSKKAPGADDVFAANLEKLVEEAPQPKGYCSKDNVEFPITNNKLCGGGNSNIGWKFVFNFNEPYGEKWVIQFGVDFGLGGAIKVDNNWIWSKNQDIWWGGSDWNNPAVFQVNMKFDAGSHTVIMYGGENCCDGPMNVRFRRGKDDFQPLTVAAVKGVIAGAKAPAVRTDDDISVNVESRQVTAKVAGNGEQFAIALRNQFEEAPQPKGYCAKENVKFPITNVDLCKGPNSNIGWKFEFYWNEPFGEKWILQFGFDFGFGGAIFVDDKVAWTATNDIWWGGSDFNNPAVVQISQKFAKGKHSLVVYGGEGCCDGAQNVRFKRGGIDFLTLSEDNVRKVLTDAKQPVARSDSDISVDVETRFLNSKQPGEGEDFAANLRNAFESAGQPQGYCSKENVQWPIQNQGLCKGPNSNIAWKFEFYWNEPFGEKWTVQFGVDFGLGGAVLVDGQWQYINNKDIWWGGSDWNNPAVFGINQKFSKGPHSIIVYGAENCCDGSAAARFKRGKDEFQPLTEENVKKVIDAARPDVPRDYIVDVESRFFNKKSAGAGEDFANNLRDDIEKAPQNNGYCSKENVQFPFQNQGLCKGPNQNIGWKFTIQFVEPYGEKWQFQFGTDFGWGGATLVDQKWTFIKSDDIWWGGADFNNPAVFAVSQKFSEGKHSIIVYGGENCCDGANNVRFRRGKDGWQPLTQDNLKKVHDSAQAPAGDRAENDISVDIETRFLGAKPPGAGEDFANNLKNAVEDAPQNQGYCSKENAQLPSSNQQLCKGGNSNIGWKIEFYWFEPYGEKWTVQFGVDFGFGGAILVDGKWYWNNNNDIWWGGSDWNNPAVFQVNTKFERGTHSIVVYGGEGCCDGPMNIRFKRGKGEFQVLSEDNVKKVIADAQPNVRADDDVSVDLESKFVNAKPAGEGEDFANKLKEVVENAPQNPGYCSKENVDWPLTNNKLCGGGNSNIGWKFEFFWNEPFGEKWTIQFGVDFGFGGAVLVDGTWAYINNKDIWWGGSDWNNPAVFQVYQKFGKGKHVLVVYGAENCCDGPMSVRFRRGNSDFLPLNEANVKKAIADAKEPQPRDFIVDLETRFVNAKVPGEGEAFGKNLRDQFDGAQSRAGYCGKDNVNFPQTNGKLCGGGNSNIGWKLDIQWEEPFQEKWIFQFGVDFGFGGAVFVDGKFAFANTKDLWWANNWSSPAVFQVSQTFPQGKHTIQVYGGEGCCDGSFDVRFKRGTTDYLPLTQDNLKKVKDEAQPKEPRAGDVQVDILTRFVDAKVGGQGQEFAFNLKDQVENAPENPGYCSKENVQFPQTNGKLCGGGNSNIGWKFEFTFTEPFGEKWTIQLGTDFGFGGAVFIDGKFLFANPNDLWWAGDWNSPAVLQINQKFNKGKHVVTVYGGENCCDGSFDARYKRGTGDSFKPLNEDNVRKTITDAKEPLPRDDNDISVDLETKNVGAKPAGEGEDFAKNLRQAVETAPQDQGYCSKENVIFPQTNGKLCGGGNKNIGWKLEFYFNEPFGEYWQIQFGVDFGFGAAVFVDDAFHYANNNNLWFANDWNSQSIFQVFKKFGKGKHSIIVYGAEDCCDGNFDVRFKRGRDADWKPLTEENVKKTIEAAKTTPPVQKKDDDISVDVETRFIGKKPPGEGEQFGRNIRYAIETSPNQNGYCAKENVHFPVTNGNLCNGPNKQIGWKFEFYFFEPSGEKWEIELGTDFGYGSAIFVDDVWVESKTNNLWWEQNWNSPAVLKIHQTFEKGTHQVVVYGAEDCCDGGFDARFKRGSMPNFKPLNEDNVKKAIKDHTGDEDDDDDENPLQCPDNVAVVFSECNFQGKKYVINRLKSKVNIDWQIKSIKIPAGYVIDFYSENNFKGKVVTFKKDEECIDQLNFGDIDATRTFDIKDDKC